MSAALGEALGGLYEAELDRVARSSDPDFRKRRVEELGKQLREPALEALRAGGSSSSLLAARIAFYDRHWDEAARLAGDILRDDPGA